MLIYTCLLILLGESSRQLVRAQQAAFLPNSCAPSLRIHQGSCFRYLVPAPFLEKLVNSVVATGGACIAGRNTIVPARNNPNTAGDTIMQSWEYKNRVNDRLNQEREEATLGISRQKDPDTGRIYDMSQNAYDPTRGGYVNPVRPTELLQHVAPGE